MIVKLRVGLGPRIRRSGIRNRGAALTTASLLTPLSLMAFALGGWRIAADLDLASRFAFDAGPLSHWQIWMAMALALQSAAVLLNRYADPPEEDR